MGLFNHSYPIIFGTFLVGVSATFFFRQNLLPTDLQAETDKFYHAEDKEARQLLRETIRQNQRF